MRANMLKSEYTLRNMGVIWALQREVSRKTQHKENAFPFPSFFLLWIEPVSIEGAGLLPRRRFRAFEPTVVETLLAEGDLGRVPLSAQGHWSLQALRLWWQVTNAGSAGHLARPPPCIHVALQRPASPPHPP